MNIDIKDYKEYSTIEIEIKPVKNEHGKFINIKEKEREYYQIYFNNNKEEIKRNYIKKNEKIEIIQIVIDYPVKSLKDLFKSCHIIESIIFKKSYKDNINDMSGMFSWCSSLEELDFSNLNTNNVKDMSDMLS